MSNNIIRIAAGVLGLACAALPQMAAAQTYYDAPPSYRPSIQEDFRYSDERGGYDRAPPRYEERRAAYDEDYRPRHHHHDRPLYDESRPYDGFGGPEGYGRPDHWSRWDRPIGLPVDGYRAPVDGYRPVAVPIGPVYGAAARRGSPDLGCTIQRSEQESYAGGREVVTRRSCYAR